MKRHHLTLLTKQRLRSSRYVNDGQPPHAHRDMLLMEFAHSIRTTRDHSCEQPSQQPPSLGGSHLIDNPGNTAHVEIPRD
ncbi:MAG: hypothetical protein AMXMBFR67_06860 [Nitrospira sp.]